MAETKAENGRPWTPTAKQIKMAELLLNPDDRRTKKAKYESINLPERTFYRWMKDERFIKYLNDQLGHYSDSQLYEVWQSLIIQCKRGNVQAMKLFFQLKGLYNEW